MSDAIADLFITLSMVDAPALASMAEFSAAGEEMVVSLTTSLAALQGELAGLGAEFTGLAASVTEAGAAAGATDAEIATMATGFGEVGAAAGAMGTEVDTVLAGMKAQIAATDAELAALPAELAAATTETAALSTGLVTASTEAATSTAAVGTAMAGTDAKAAAANTTLGMSNNALLAVGTAAIGAAYESVKMAGDFQASITRLNTSAGESQANLKMVNDGILAMAGSVGYSSDALSAAMYKIESGGQHGAAGLQVLQAAAQGAKAENADLTTVSDALTSAMVDYKIPADQAAATTSKLVAATSQGKMTFEELAGSLSAILPIASANHVSFNDILGDLASMTVHGMSAQQATQNMANAIRNLSGGNAVASKELAALGMNATEVSKDLGAEGLSGTINEISQRITSQMGPDGLVVVNLTNALKGMSPAVQELGSKVLDGSMSMKDFTASAKGLDVISAKQVTSFAALAGSMHGVGTESKSGTDALQTYSQAMQKAMGGATGLNVALMIGGENAGNTATAIKAVSGATADAAGNVQGWSEIQGNFNQKIDEAKSAFGALVISIGEKLLPVLTVLAGGLSTVATWLAQHQTIATALAVVIGGVLVLALGALIAKFAVWAANSAAGMVLDAAKGAVWVATKIGQFLGVSAAAEAETVAEVAAAERGNAMKLAGAVAGGAKWLAVKTAQGVAAVASAVYYAAASYAPWVLASAQQLVSTITSGAVWLATKAAQGAAAVASAVASGAATAAAWVASNAAMLAGQLASGALWLASWVATGVAAAASSVAEAAVAAAAWVAANAAIILATGGVILVIGAVIAIGYELITNWGAVENAAAAVWGAVTGAIQNMWNVVSGLINSLIGMFSNSASWLLSAGYNIVVGLWNGIVSGWSWLTGMVSNLASSLLSTAKSALGIGSPSKKFADEVGAWIAPGLAQGIAATTHVATTAAQNLAQSVTAAAASGGTLGGQGLSAVGSGMTGGLGLSSLNTGMAGGGGINIALTVQGHVWTTQDLVTEIQTQLLQHGVRNNSPGINYAYS